MKDKQTRKLICRVTGKPLFAGKQYYQKKVEKAGSEDKLHSMYICREAKNLLKKGYTIHDAKESLDVSNFKHTITEEEVKMIIGDTKSLRLNNNDEPKTSIIRTDPDVLKFIENITNGT
jgi:hypothetical protein